MAYSASSVAKWFLSHVRSLNSDEDEECLTNLKLQKLLYYAQGSSLALHDRALFCEPIIHWQHGPVVREVYWEYAQYKGNQIRYEEDYSDVVDPKTDELLQMVYSTFGCYSAWGLRNMTHEEDPWKNTQMHDQIENKVIQVYFKEHYVA